MEKAPDPEPASSVRPGPGRKWRRSQRQRSAVGGSCCSTRPRGPSRWISTFRRPEPGSGRGIGGARSGRVMVTPAEARAGRTGSAVAGAQPTASPNPGEDGEHRSRPPPRRGRANRAISATAVQATAAARASIRRASPGRPRGMDRGSMSARARRPGPEYIGSTTQPIRCCPTRPAPQTRASPPPSASAARRSPPRRRAGPRRPARAWPPRSRSPRIPAGRAGRPGRGLQRGQISGTTGSAANMAATIGTVSRAAPRSESSTSRRSLRSDRLRSAAAGTAARRKPSKATWRMLPSREANDHNPATDRPNRLATTIGVAALKRR